MRKLFLGILVFLSLHVWAEDDGKCDLSISAEVVSTYVWRGSYQTGTSIQPFMEFTVGGFSLGTWGSVDIAGFGYKEVDLMASFSFKNVTVGLYDTWIAGEMNYNYFDLSKTTLHLLEAWVAYSFDRIPLSIGWYTSIAGDETCSKYLKNGKLKNAFPTYIEVTYTFPVRKTILEAAIGVSPWKSSTLYNRYDEGGMTDGFAVVNLSLKASRDIKMTDSYSLPVFGQLIFNPAKEDTFLVFGIRF